MYSFSKQLGKLVFGEALAYGVRVTVIEPGAVATELITSTKHEGRQAVATAFYAPETKILEDGDIAHAILYAVTRQHQRIDDAALKPGVLNALWQILVEGSVFIKPLAGSGSSKGVLKRPEAARS